MNDHHRQQPREQREQEEEKKEAETRWDRRKTKLASSCLTSGACTRAAQVSRMRAIKPLRYRDISLATPIMWLLIHQIVCREMALANATNSSLGPQSAQTTFLGPISISNRQLASVLGAPIDHQHPREDQHYQHHPRPTTPVPVESGSLDAPSIVAPNCSSDCMGASQINGPEESKEFGQQSERHPEMMAGMNLSRAASGKLIKREALYHSPPQALIEPTLHGTVTVGRRTKRPDRKRLEELGPEDDVSKYLFKNFVPRWMDVCNHRPDRNDTLVRLLVGTFSYKSADKIREEMLANSMPPPSRASDANAAAQQQQRKISRRKRAIVYQVHEHLRHHEQHQQLAAQHQRKQQQQVFTFQDSQKSAILFKSGGSHNKKHWWYPKKTTFKLSQSKNRFYTNQPSDALNGFVSSSPPVSGPKRATTTTTTPRPQVDVPLERKEQIKAVAHSLSHLDIKMSWQLFGSLKTIEKLKDNLRALNETIEADKKRAQNEPDVSDERRQEILDQRQRWLPRYEDLALLGDDNDDDNGAIRSSLYNITGGLYTPRLRQLFLNMTEYFQYFGVALEQMKFDQQYFYKHDWDHDERYRTVDRRLQELLCEIENYLELEREYHVGLEQFRQLTAKFKWAPESLDRQEVFYAKFRNNSLIRERPYTSNLVLESPIARAFDRLDPETQTKVLHKMETFLPENRPPAGPLAMWANEEDLKPPAIVRHLTRPTYMWREIMPLEQRQLYTLKERAMRDQSIFQELSPFLRSLESLLEGNYSPW